MTCSLLQISKYMLADIYVADITGFNVSLEPGFSVSRLCWMLAYGGVYAVANLRCVVVCCCWFTVVTTVQGLGALSLVCAT